VDGQLADGATPLDLEEEAELIPRHISTRAELNTWEQANIAKAVVWLGARRRRGPVLSLAFLRELHQRMFGETWRWAGQFRRTGKNIGVPASEVPEQLGNLLDDAKYWADHATYSPEEIATRLHHRLAWIHPFGDGNGRTARLAEFEILLALGVPAAAAHVLSNHYNQTRTEYYRHLDISHKSGGNVFPFLLYALQGFVDGLNDQIDTVRGQQLHVHWINYIHDMFRDKDSPADIRRRRLVIDLSERVEPVPIAEVRRVSPRMAEAYATKGDKTLSRDINKLLALGLIEKTPEGIRARSETMRAFHPPSAGHAHEG